HYRIDFRLKDGGAYESKVTITLKPKSALGQIELDSYGQNIKDAEVDGAKATFAVKTDDAARTGTVTVKPAAPLAAGKDATVELDVEGTAGESHDGFFTVSDPEDPSLPPFFFTHFEPNYAQRFFPCND